MDFSLKRACRSTVRLFDIFPRQNGRRKRDDASYSAEHVCMRRVSRKPWPARIMKFDKNGKFLKAWGRKGMGPGEFDVVHTLGFDSRGRLFVGDRQNNRIQIFDQDGKFIAQWFQFGRPSGIYIDKKTDTIYVADSESHDGRTNTGRMALAQTGYGYNLGAQRGIRIGSARDGSVKYFIPDPCPYPYAGGSSLAEGVTADSEGN